MVKLGFLVVQEEVLVRLHPAITGVTTSHQVKKMRPHIKMLCGNYLTFEMKSNQSGGSPQCRLYLSENETLRHLILICGTFEDLRSRIKTSITSICIENKIEIDVKKLTHEQFTQFILDPSS